MYLDAGLEVLEATGPDDPAEDGDQVVMWRDQADDGNDASQATATEQPLFKTGIINGLPVVRFDGVDNNLEITQFAGGNSAAEIFIVIAVDVDPPAAAGQTGLWKFNAAGPQASSYPWTTGVVFEGWGTTSRLYSGDPTEDLTVFRLYNVRTQSGQYDVYIDTVLEWTRASNTVEFNQDPILIGGDTLWGRYLDGDVAVVAMYDHVLTGTERTAVETWADDKFALAY
jgi:hypothetical protein